MKLEQIKHYVTHFSEELKVKATQEQEVIVGGKITSIVPPINDDFPMYIFIVDDQVGTTHVHVPNLMYTTYENQLSIGEYAFFEGFVNITTSYSKKSEKKNVSVYAYGLKDTSSDQGELL